jgi:hypothetical protein
MSPASNSACAASIACLALMRSLRLASCCSVEVVYGGGGRRSVRRACTSRTTCAWARAAASSARPPRAWRTGAARGAPSAPVAASRPPRRPLRLGGRGGVGLRLRGDERHQPLGVRRLERPVGAGGEGEDLALALAEDVQRRRLAAPGRLRAGGPADLLRAVEADDAVEHAPRPLRVHARRVDRARPRHGGADRRGRDLAELDAHRVALPAPADLELPGEVPGDRLPLAVGVGGEEHPVEPPPAMASRSCSTTFASRTTYDSSSVARSTP